MALKKGQDLRGLFTNKRLEEIKQQGKTSAGTTQPTNVRQRGGLSALGADATRPAKRVSKL
jgi:hypothetical protein